MKGLFDFEAEPFEFEAYGGYDGGGAGLGKLTHEFTPEIAEPHAQAGKSVSSASPSQYSKPCAAG